MAAAPDPARDPARPPDWRWRLAAAPGPPPADPLARAARRLRRARAVAAGDAAAARLAAAAPAAAAALALYEAGGPARDVLEARVLAGEAPADVARKGGLTAGAVAVYEGLFFDVRDRLGCPDFVLARAVPGALGGHWPPGTAWKVFAYLGGAHALDALLGAAPAGRRPAGPDGAAGFFAAEARAGVERRAAVAARAGGAEPRLDAALLLRAARAAAAGAAAAGADEGPAGGFAEHVRAMLAEIPWAAGADGAAPPGADAADAGAAELRADELLGVAAGRSPVPADLAGVVLPPPRPRPGKGAGGRAPLPD